MPPRASTPASSAVVRCGSGCGPTARCAIDGDAEGTRAVRFGLYQLLIAANGDDPTVNIGAKSLTGEGYKGHVFWDTEVLMLPFFIYTQPDTARSLLRYRYHTLPAARELARESGMRGARYPWESADTGREECPIWTVDGANRIWPREEEIHVSADVAYGILTYVEASGDTDFLIEFGAEILFETSRFWVDRATTNPSTDRYSINQVMGPDEFHSHVDNNAFTNRMAQWALTQSAQVYADLAQNAPDALAGIVTKIGLDPEEVEQWRNVAAKIVYHLDPAQGVLEQFDGYFQRLDVPVTEWDQNDMPRYPEGYNHYNCEETQLLKQPDVVMLMHVLPEEFSEEVKKANFEYYEASYPAQVLAQSRHPRDHGHRGGRLDPGAAVLPPVRAGRPGQQPGQHRRKACTSRPPAAPGRFWSAASAASGSGTTR